uniref:Uncharacterized protein n=1 Tax=Arundo donax TaxID=35708 RepID=A0A0A8Z9H8_ARUDO
MKLLSTQLHLCASVLT